MSGFGEKVLRAFGIDPFMSMTVRHEWVKRQLSALPEGLALLDAGAGPQRYRKFCTHLKYESQDFCQYDGKGNDEGLQVGEWDVSEIDIVCDIVKIPRPDASYDAILCTEVFEHIPDPVAAVKEFSRLLKKGGKLILTLPSQSLVHQAPYYYCSGFSRFWLEKTLGDNGFEIRTMDRNGNYFDFLMIEVIRNNYSVASKYSGNGFFMKLLNAFFSFFLMLILKHYSKKDRGSSEIGGFGIMVVCEKKS